MQKKLRFHALLTVPLLFAVELLQAQTISTYAGGQQGGYDGDNLSAVTLETNRPTGVVTDTAGNIYFCDWMNNRVRKVTASTGILSTIAGDGTGGFTGDGGPAANAEVNGPMGICLDRNGNIYFADQNNYRIRRIDAATGTITTICGNGTGAYTGDNGPASAAQVNSPAGMCIDTSGNLYIVDQGNYVIRKINALTGIITTVAGNGTPGYTGDGGAATFATLSGASGATVDAAGNLFIADAGNDVIRKVNSTTGLISTIAGTGSAGFSGDGGQATSAHLTYPSDVALDASGNIYIADQSNHVIRKITVATGVISTISGTGTVFGYYADGTQASLALLNQPVYLCVSSQGKLIFSDNGNNRLRAINLSTGIINTVAGSGGGNFYGDGLPAAFAQLNSPFGIAFDAGGNLYIGDWQNNRVRKVSAATGNMSTIAGNGSSGYSGDGGAATNAMLYNPAGICVNAAGDVFIADIHNNRIRKVSAATGNISTVAGNGTAGYTGDGGQATSAALSSPCDISSDAAGNIYVADNANNVIRKINMTTGVITTVAGTGAAGYTGDGGAATLATLQNPTGVYVDIQNNLYIADWGNNVIRKVNGTTGVITTVAGDGTPGYSGDGGQAVNAQLNEPTDMCVDSFGNLFISDGGNYIVREVNAGGYIATIAGTNMIGYSGDGGPATSALLSIPVSVCVDSANHLYISDQLNNRIRTMAVPPLVTGIAEPAENSSSFIYPNPSNGNAVIDLGNYPNENYTAVIYDLSGKIVETENFAGNGKFALDLDALSNGMYVIRISGEKTTIEQKLIVQH